MIDPHARRRGASSPPPVSGEDGQRTLTTHRSFPGSILKTLSRSGNSSTRGAQPSTQQPQLWTITRTVRVALVAAVLVMLSFAAGSHSCMGSRCAAGSERCHDNREGAVSSMFGVHRSGNGTAGNVKISAADGRFGSELTGRPPNQPEDRPYYDLVVAVLVLGGDSDKALEEIARVRKVYARYGSEVVPSGGSTATPPLTFRVVFVVGRAGLGDNVELPETGLLLGDFYHVDVREGYEHLSDKTKAMTGLTNHLRFRFLAKTDGDTFPCLARVTQQLTDVPEERQPRVYAGLLNRCGKVFPKGHKLHDPEFIAATGGTINCHPMYHQGAFYILGIDIVAHLHRSRDLLAVMSVEDAMMGLWLLGVDKEMLDIGGSFYCRCFTHPLPKMSLSFYHFCKTEDKMDVCIEKFGAC